MLTKAYILAGGKGTRLASVVADIPKPMADIAGKPFLHFLMKQLSNQGFRSIVLIVSYKYHVIKEYFGDKYLNMDIQYEIEESPRGTGGMISELSKKMDVEILLLNGDTFFDIDIKKFYSLFQNSKADILIAAAKVSNSSRYGTLEIKHGKIIDFIEKSDQNKEAWINGGIYLFHSSILSQQILPYSFSFECDFLMKNYKNLNIEANESIKYFIDIGIPDDYLKAQLEIPSYFLPLIDKSWTLYLDRDGVLNTFRPKDYVKSIEEFEWISESKQAVVALSKIFGKTIVVTNQQGVGKGLMTAFELEKIHFKIQDEVREIGGKIDEIYYCPHLAVYQSNSRKPKIGMALKSKLEFPDIDFKKSIMIGDMVTDMMFGRTIGAFNVLIHNEMIETKIESHWYDIKLNSLVEFAVLLQKLNFQHKF